MSRKQARLAEVTLGHIDNRALRFVGVDEHAFGGPGQLPAWNVVGPVVAGDVQVLGSYSWMGDTSDVDIAIPGSPPLWRESPASRDDPIRISTDAASPAAPSKRGPAHGELLAMRAAVSPSFDWMACDVVAPRAALVDIFHWAHGATKELRLDVALVGARTLVIEHAGRASAPANAPGSAERGYIRTETVAYPGLEEGANGGHRRIISYTFGELRLVVRTPVDARIPRTLSSCFGTADKAQNGAIGGLRFRRSTEATAPQDELLEISVRTAARTDRRDTAFPKLFFGRIPLHVLAEHDGHGTVVNVVREAAGTHPLLREAAASAQGTLCRLHTLLVELQYVALGQQAQGHQRLTLVSKRGGQIQVLPGGDLELPAEFTNLFSGAGTS